MEIGGQFITCFLANSYFFICDIKQI